MEDAQRDRCAMFRDNIAIVNICANRPIIPIGVMANVSRFLYSRFERRYSYPPRHTCVRAAMI